MQIIEVPITKLKPDKNQPRQTFDKDRIAGMAQSIKTEGVINPIEIDKQFVIITGEMRWRAAKLSGLKTVPCKVLTIKSYERFRRQVVENLHNLTMNPMDTARALQKLLKELDERLAFIKKPKGGLPDQGIRQLSREIGMPQSTLEEYLGLFKATQAFQKAVEEQKISHTMLRAINRTPLPFQKAVEKKILKGELKTRQGALEVAAGLKRNPEKAAEILAIDYSKFPESAAIGNAVGKISPRYTEIVAKALEPSQEFGRIKTDLFNWLDKHPPQSLIRSKQLTISMGVVVLINKLAAWAKQADQKQLTN